MKTGTQLYAVYMYYGDDELMIVSDPTPDMFKAQRLAEKYTRRNRKNYQVHGAGLVA